MTQLITWRAAVTIPGAPAGPVTDDQADALMTAGDSATAQLVDGTVRLEFDVDAGTLAAATDAAIRQATAAYAKAYGTRTKPTGVRVVTADQHQAEIARPPAADLAGYKEIGEMLGISYQRAQQLAKRDDFPEPIARLGMGPVYTRTSVAEFDKRWERKSGRPRKEA